MKQLNATIFCQEEKIPDIKQAIHKLAEEGVNIYSVTDHKYDHGNTLKEIADLFYEGSLDVDVYDTDIDMAVAFVFDFHHTDGSYYDKFLEWLASNVEVAHIGDMGITCYFSKLFARYGEKVTSFIKEEELESGEFDDEDLCFDLTLCLESLISGCSSESFYKKLCDLFEVE